jgi:hypothetical protein
VIPLLSQAALDAIYRSRRIPGHPISRRHRRSKSDFGHRCREGLDENAASIGTSQQWTGRLKFVFLTNKEHLWRPSRVYVRWEEPMDHNESVRKFEHLMLKQADHARETAIELEALVSQMPSEKSRELAQLQVKASHKQAKEFRELAQKVHES